MVPSPRATDRHAFRLPANMDGFDPAFAAGPKAAGSLLLVGLLLAGTLAVVRTPVGSAKTVGTSRAGRFRMHDAGPTATGRVGRRPRLVSPSAIAVDAETGRVFIGNQPDRRMPVASLVKIMTALLVLEHGDLSATVVVSRRAASTPPVSIGLRPGQRISVRALLYGMLLRSGNDAAMALAEHVSGSMSSFVTLMNERANQLGLSHTRFADPAGLDDRGYGTARDLATLTRAALQVPAFTAIVNTDRFVLRDGRRRARTLWNIDLFRGQYQGAFGVKTGFTTRAGQCLVAAARRNDRTLIAVVLGDSPASHWQDAFGDAARLLDYGFAMSPSRLS